MSAVLAIAFLFAFVIPLALWLAIESETSQPTVVDRAEAERIAKERGGRNASRSAGGSDRFAADDDPSVPGRDRHTERGGWGTRSTAAGRRDDRDGTDEWGDRGRP